MGHPHESRTRLPIFIIAFFMVVTILMGYYIKSYSEENKTLKDSYEVTEWSLKKSRNLASKADRDLKLCKGREGSFEQSNRELQSSVKKSDNEISVLSAEKEIYNKNYLVFRQFYTDVKSILGKADDPDFNGDTGSGPILQKAFDNLKEILAQWNGERQEAVKLKAEKEKLNSNIVLMQQQMDELTSKNSELIAESKRNKDNMVEMQAEIDHLQKERHERGFQMKKVVGQPNVVRQDLNVNVDDEQTKSTEHSETLNKRKRKPKKDVEEEQTKGTEHNEAFVNATTRKDLVTFASVSNPNTMITSNLTTAATTSVAMAKENATVDIVNSTLSFASLQNLNLTTDTLLVDSKEQSATQKTVTKSSDLQPTTEPATTSGTKMEIVATDAARPSVNITVKPTDEATDEEEEEGQTQDDKKEDKDEDKEEADEVFN